jgi:hypothetical protein
VKFQRQVYSNENVDYTPNVLVVDISPERAVQIRRLAEFLRSAKAGDFDIYQITAWDYSPDWFSPNPEGDASILICDECAEYVEMVVGEDADTHVPCLLCPECGHRHEAERMECCEIVLALSFDKVEFHYRALVKHRDDWCESERIGLEELPGAEVQDDTGVMLNGVQLPVI